MSDEIIIFEGEKKMNSGLVITKISYPLSCALKSHGFDVPDSQIESVCTDCGQPVHEDYDYCYEHLILEARGVR